MRKTTKKRMSKAPSKKSSAKRDAYSLGGQTRAGKAIAKRRAGRGADKLKSIMGEIKKSRKK